MMTAVTKVPDKGETAMRRSLDSWQYLDPDFYL